MNVIFILGLIAALISTIAFLPQVFKSWKTRKTDDISLGSYILVVSGVFLWLIYGFLIKDFPLVAANGVTFILTFWILVLKIKYR